MNDTEETIINGLSELILAALKAHQMESHYPSSSGDEMDDKLARTKNRYTRLRLIREQFEDCVGYPR